MAYLRTYQALAGDPGLFKRLRKMRLPRAIRKFQPGRAAGGLARMGVGFVPGVGPVASALYGDPGLFGSIGRGLGRIAGRIGGSAVGKAAGRVLGGVVGGGAMGGIPGAVIGGVASAGAGALIGRAFGGGGSSGRRYRRINVANVKALNRAVRRVQGFSKLAKETIQLERQVRLKHRKGRR